MTDELMDPNLSDLLRRCGSIEVPPADPAQERALLAAFDAHVARPHQRTPRLVWATAIGLLIAVTGAINWLVVTEGPPDIPAPPVATDDSAGFVAVPGADAWPPFESGAIVRVELPVSALVELGLVPPSPALGIVQADILIAQDGLARAVRLVQQ